MYGEEAARAALRLDTALQAGRVARGSAARAATLADFGVLLSRHGDAGWSFWNRYVVPHWGKWLAGGALTAYLVAPEEFMDVTGTITEGGAKRLTELVGATTAAAIRGVGGGSGKAMGEIGSALQDTYFSGWQGLLALGGTIVVLAFALPRSRRFLFSKFWQVAVSPPAASSPDAAEAHDQQSESRSPSESKTEA